MGNILKMNAILWMLGLLLLVQFVEHASAQFGEVLYRHQFPENGLMMGGSRGQGDVQRHSSHHLRINPGISSHEATRIRILIDDDIGNRHQAHLFVHVNGSLAARLDVPQQRDFVEVELDRVKIRRIDLYAVHQSARNHNDTRAGNGEEVHLHSLEVYGRRVVAAPNAPDAATADRDRDGVPDAFEQRLLDAFCPIFLHHDDGQIPPLPISWVRRHAEFLDAKGNAIDAKRWKSAARLRLRDDLKFGVTNGKDPHTWSEVLDRHGVNVDHLGIPPRDFWSTPRSVKAGATPMGVIYGIVERDKREKWEGQTAYRALYVMYRGKNETSWPEDLPESILGTDYDHDGDWLCVELTLLEQRGGSFRVEEALLHNHGRQIEVDRRGLRFEGDRPLVFIEKGTNEPLHFAGEGHFFDKPNAPDVPIGTRTNELLPPVLGRGVVRAHSNAWYPITSVPERGGVVNLGSRTHPMGEDGDFFWKFKGQWGGTKKSPHSPAFQTKMIDREFHENWVFDR